MDISNIKFRQAIAVLLILGLLASSNFSNAQNADPAQRAAKLSERMKTELSLTDDQYGQVKAINEKYAHINDSVINGSSGKLEKVRVMKSIQKAKTVEMKKVLTDAQFEKYRQIVAESEEKARQRYRERNN